MTLSAHPSEQQPMGYFRIFAQPPGGVSREITLFRDVPVMPQRASFSDPFSDQTAALAFPQITMFDELGKGDLDWFVPDCAIDIQWQNYGGYEETWAWEGYIASISGSLDGSNNTISADLKGALYGLDDYLAIPSFPKRPIPYEILMAQAFDQNAHPTALGEFRILFPQDWSKAVPAFTQPEYLGFLKPWGVATGQLWTGFTSRSTGSWEPLLTGHVQSLLTVMFAEGGSQWSVRNRGNRTPELYLRVIPEPDDPDIVEIQLGSPGVNLNVSKDYTQRASVIYGQGVDEAGISYSGMQVSPDGATTMFKPFAYNPAVWPRTQNPSYDSRYKAKETMVRFQDGVDQLSAIAIAQGQYQRFAEPGITGTLTLKTDPRYADGNLCPRLLLRAGVTLRLMGLFGSPGVFVHCTQSEVDFSELTTTLTFDSKYRDQLTVAEVMARTRDALTPMRALQVGKYSNTVQDLVLPWSTKEGSGCVPMAASEFFNEKLPSTATFPYEQFTISHPPSNPAYRPYYVKINPTTMTDSSKNWSGVTRDGKTLMAIPIRMAQAGTIKLSQIAAYDKNGHVLPVRFHASVYNSNGVAADAMPQFPDDPTSGSPKYLKPNGLNVDYAAGQANPFFENAWETVKQDGSSYDNAAYLPAEGAGLVVGWGNYFEPAGYSPGRFSRGATRTGLLEDASTWTWDLSSLLDLQSPANNANQEYAGMLFIQIFCDEQGTQPVYFMGRFFKQEAGTS